ncbi:hypothetical protein ZOSMA_142G00070 [Zostera marina]|uniref:Uncharacterized protein n=1 Tax=Zostera marina TaxID=29655 RepID=A0A0K9PXD7_ZOSMR|nr:hypothetical protein ZOSMA_142G00070 [Zostera marina]
MAPATYGASSPPAISNGTGDSRILGFPTQSSTALSDCFLPAAATPTSAAATSCFSETFGR